jgi:hypothetical protein
MNFSEESIKEINKLDLIKKWKMMGYTNKNSKDKGKIN